jgi:hypothetical protein
MKRKKIVRMNNLGNVSRKRKNTPPFDYIANRVLSGDSLESPILFLQLWLAVALDRRLA